MSRIIRKEHAERLPIVGRIKTGMKGMNDKGVEMPKSLDYFIASSENPEYIKDFNEIYGKKPTKLSITFLSDDDKVSCNERYELRTGKKLFAHGDGREFYVYNPDVDGMVLEVAEDTETKMADIAKRSKGDGNWQQRLVLRFALLKMGHILGAWEYSTGGAKSSIREIIASYDLVKSITGDRVRGIPFDLTVKKVVSQKPGAKHSYPVVSLIANIGQDNLDRVREFLEQGIEMRGLLTNERIDEMAGVKQITAEIPQLNIDGIIAEMIAAESSDHLRGISVKYSNSISIHATQEEKKRLNDAYKKQNDTFTEGI